MLDEKERYLRTSGDARGGSLLRLAEERGQSRTELLPSEGLVLEKRELPTIERLREPGIAVGIAERGHHLDSYRSPEGVEPRRLTGRLGRSDGQDRLDPEGPSVERLEEDGPGGERS